MLKRLYKFFLVTMAFLTLGSLHGGTGQSLTLSYSHLLADGHKKLKLVIQESIQLLLSDDCIRDRKVSQISVSDKDTKNVTLVLTMPKISSYYLREDCKSY